MEDIKQKFGKLNPWNDSAEDETLYIRGSTGFLSTVFSSAQSKFQKNSLSGFTEFKAIVLYVENSDTKSSKGFLNFDPISSFLNLNTKDSNTTKYRVIANIPELHAHLPAPLPTVGNKYDWEILSLYPTFEGSAGGERPNVGDIVRVTFSNIGTQEGPIYLGLDGSGGNSAPTNNGAAPGGASGSPTPKFNGKETNGDMKKSSISEDGLYIPNHPNAKSKISPSPHITTELQEFERHKRRNSPTQIVIHESVGDSKEKTIVALKGPPSNPRGVGVHYYIDRKGSAFQFMDPSWVVYHASGVNDHSIGIEIENPYLGHGKGITGPWVVASKDGTKTYLVPPVEQLETAWNLVKKLTVDYEIPMGFPGVTSLTQRGSQQPNGERKFSWTRVPGSGDLPGVRAHNRTEHADGIFIEHYILCRASGYNSYLSYMETLKRAQMGYYTDIPSVK